ncbi:MAG: NADH-quinone oxidoreductase subunit N [Candidatus Krumholzibacteriia bacterium]
MQDVNLFVPNWSDLAYWRPELTLLGAFLLALIGDLLVRGRHPVVPFLISLAGLLLALAFSIFDLGRAEAVTVMGPLVVVDGLAGFFRLLFTGGALAVVLYSWTSDEIMGPRREAKGEFYALIALLTGALCVMAEAQDILMLYLSMEVVGLASYVMAGYMRTSLRSSEASLKYVIYASVSSGIMLYGLSLLYGLTGETNFSAIRQALEAYPPNPYTLLVVTVLILVGMGYKIAAVPFHHWAPDVYEGAPTPVTAIFSVGPKAAGFALMIRFFYTTFVAGPEAAAASRLLQIVEWPLIIALLSVVTMTYGNLVALRQENVKRMLAYSSIAHVGYLLMGFLLLTPEGLAAVLYYLLVYTLMNLGAFLVVVTINNNLRSENLADYAGLGHRLPWVGVMMFVFLVSLVGLPPTAGFVGKFYLFTAVLDREWFWLAIAAGVNSVISLFYYMRVMKAMFFTLPPVPAADRPATALVVRPLEYVVLTGLCLPVLGLGVYWVLFKDLADQAVLRFTAGVF